MNGFIYTITKPIFFYLITLLGLLSGLPVLANSHNPDKEFNSSELIFHHIKDSHEWHFASVGQVHYSIPLPIILWASDRGFACFSSARFHESATHTYHGYQISHEHISRTDGQKVYDFSITKNVASMFISVIILFGVFFTVAARYKGGPKRPSGIQSVFEPIIIFIRDEIAKPNIGPKYKRYLPYLLTVFFFIWFNNMLGLLPGGANLTGNIAVTMVLAVLTFLITTFSANKDYWKHIYNTPGVPWWLKFPLPLMPLVEFIGMFTKPLSLMIRLFANITAGHIIILSLISLTFIFKSHVIGVAASIFVVAMSFLEILVALIQAYVFTLLTSLYFGGAVAEHEHEHEHTHEAEDNIGHVKAH